ncbi:hypothetical protein RI367_007461 [Sorochytrium milnesiophthora]
MDWFVEIVRDYEPGLTDFADGFLDDELGSAVGFPYFIELVARGVEVRATMLGKILGARNLVGAVWIMERVDTAADWEMAEWARHRGHLGLLQLAVAKGQQLCQSCLTRNAEVHQQRQILRWMHQQEQTNGVFVSSSADAPAPDAAVKTETQAEEPMEAVAFKLTDVDLTMNRNTQL